MILYTFCFSLRLSIVFKSVLSYLLENISNNALKCSSGDSEVNFILALLSRFLCLLVLIWGCFICLFFVFCMLSKFGLCPRHFEYDVLRLTEVCLMANIIIFVLEGNCPV